MSYTYDHPHPAVTVDIVIFTKEEGERKVLLIRRGQAPFADMWALPGGFVGIDESLEQAARRELMEETGADVDQLRQVGAFGDPDRDPRERVISVAYCAVVPVDSLQIEAASDASEARLFGLEDLPKLAFDHAEILRRARERIRDE